MYRYNKTKALVILVFVLFLVSCYQKKPTHPNAGNIELIKKVYEHFNEHNWQHMAGLYADPAEFKDPSLGKGIVKQTRQQIIEKFAALEQHFPTIRDSIVAIYATDEQHVIVEFISTGTADDGTTFELPICTIFTLEKNLIIKDFTYYDNF